MTQPLHDPTLTPPDAPIPAHAASSTDRAGRCRYCDVDDCLVCDRTGPYYTDPAAGRWAR